MVISRLYEDYALGEISKEKYRKMTADFEAAQERLKLEIETTEEWVEQRQAMGDDPDVFIALTKKYVDVTELTQTLVNEYTLRFYSARVGVQALLGVPLRKNFGC